MSFDESIDELVDKIIDEAQVSEEEKDEIKKEKSKPFRYLTDKDEIQAILSEGNALDITVMKTSETAEIVDEQMAVMGLGNIEAIENVLKRHEASRKFKR